MPELALQTILPLFLSGCLHSRIQDLDPAAEALQIGDRYYQQRGSDPQKVDQAIEVWTTALTTLPEHTGLLARLAEAWAARAETDPARQPDDYDVARRYGLRCLLADPSVRSMVSVGRLDVRAIQQTRNAPCLTWTAFAWARWLEHHGVAGAAIDLVIVQALAQKAVSLAEPQQLSPALHALGLALALPPEPLKPPLEEAEEALLLAMQHNPSAWMSGVDLAVHVYGPQARRSQEFQAILSLIVEKALDEGSPETFINRAAQRRAAEALQEGPRPHWIP